MRRKFFHLLFIAITLYSCASLTTPTGGPKDKEPPKLIKSSPDSNQLNYKGQTIELTFNELVKLNNPKEEIIISPSPGKTIDYKAKGTKILITPKDGWRDSTTYSIIFQEGIQDITEGNSPDNLKLAFSTGNTIDSLSIKGTIKDLLRGLNLEKMTVALMTTDTFDIFTDVPGYFTKTDSAGDFTLSNIRPSHYKIYAFDDRNKNLKVESRTERYGFKASPLIVDHNIDSIEIGLINLDSRPLKLTSIRNTGLTTALRFNKFITDYSLVSDSSLTDSFGDNQTEVVIRNPVYSDDSLKVRITASDSLYYKIDSLFFIKKGKTKPTKEDFKWSPGEPTVIEETGKFTTLIKYNKPITRIDFDSLFIPLDTIKRIPITKEDITFNLHRKEITLTKDLDKKLFKTYKSFKLTAGIGFLRTIDNDTSKATSINVAIKRTEETGILLIKVETKEANFVIQLLNRDGKVVKSVQNERQITFKHLPPGECQLRAIIDKNKNGAWDPGNIQNAEEPENVVFYRTVEQKLLFPIRANWELGPLIIKF